MISVIINMSYVLCKRCTYMQNIGVGGWLCVRCWGLYYIRTRKGAKQGFEWPLNNLLLQKWKCYLPSCPCFSWVVMFWGVAGGLLPWAQHPSNLHRLTNGDNSIPVLTLTRTTFSAALQRKSGCEFKVLELKLLQHVFPCPAADDLFSGPDFWMKGILWWSESSFLRKGVQRVSGHVAQCCMHMHICACMKVCINMQHVGVAFKA